MPRGTRKQYEDRILRVQMHIQRHLDDALSLDELAEVACFSPFHFHRIFSAMVGESVMEYVRRLRLERAAGDLMYSDRRVTEIAFRAGYETHEAFTRAFRAMFGLSPKGYRDDHLNGSLSSARARGTTKPQRTTRPGEATMEAGIETFEPMTVAFVRHVGPYEQCGGAWQKLCSAPTVLSQMGPDTLSVGISYDDPDVTEPDKIRYDACVTVGDDFEPADGVDRQCIAGGDYAVMTHKGDYSGLHDCYRWLYGEWLPNSGREAKSAPSLEIYRTDPTTTPPEENITEIRVPLA